MSGQCKCLRGPEQAQSENGHKQIGAGIGVTTASQGQSSNQWSRSVELLQRGSLERRFDHRTRRAAALLAESPAERVRSVEGATLGSWSGVPRGKARRTSLPTIFAEACDRFAAGTNPACDAQESNRSTVSMIGFMRELSDSGVVDSRRWLRRHAAQRLWASSG